MPPPCRGRQGWWLRRHLRGCTGSCTSTWISSSRLSRCCVARSWPGGRSSSAATATGPAGTWSPQRPTPLANTASGPACRCGPPPVTAPTPSFCPPTTPYEVASQEVMAVLRNFGPTDGAIIEVMGWDEALVGATTDAPEDLARRIQDAVCVRAWPARWGSATTCCGPSSPPSSRSHRSAATVRPASAAACSP